MSRKREEYKKLPWKVFWENKHILDDYKKWFNPHFNQYQDREEYVAFMNLKYLESLVRYYNSPNHKARITTYLHNTFRKSLSEFLASNSPNIRVGGKKTDSKANPQYIEIKYFNEIEEVEENAIDSSRSVLGPELDKECEILQGLSNIEMDILTDRIDRKLSHKNIARYFHMSEANARKQFQRAKEKIKHNAIRMGYNYKGNPWGF